MLTDIQEQIERRGERACEEILKIVNKGSHPLFSQFEVKSVSGRAYRVEIRSLDEMQNSCTRSDYRTNLIGTYKYIEGVLIYLGEEYGDKLEKLLKQHPRGTQIYLHGALVGALLQILPALFAGIESLSAREKSLVSVSETVVEYLSLLQDGEEMAQRKKWFLQLRALSAPYVLRCTRGEVLKDLPLVG